MGKILSRKRTSSDTAGVGGSGEKIHKKYKIEVKRYFGVNNAAYGAQVTSHWIGSRYKEGKFILPDPEERLVDIKQFEKVRILSAKDEDPDHTFLAKFSRNQKYYVVKVNAKSKIAENHLREDIVREITLASKLSNPFVANSFCVTQCPRAIYRVMDFCVGGSISNLLARHKRIPDEAMKFYCAEIAAAIIYLHERHIIAHRNIRASNVYIGEHGHVKLAGFERCIQLQDEAETIFTGEKDYGSDWYTPPELIPPRMINKVLKSNPDKIKKHHMLGVDWWQYACLCYHILTRKSPYGNEKGGDETAYLLMCSKIIGANYIPCPRHVRDEVFLTALLEGIFKLKQEERWGWEDVEDCQWFSSIDWDDLKNVRPPFMPYTKVEATSRHFPKISKKVEVAPLHPIIDGSDISHTDVADPIVDVCYSYSKQKPISELLQRRRSNMKLRIDPKLAERFHREREESDSEEDEKTPKMRRPRSPHDHNRPQRRQNASSLSPTPVGAASKGRRRSPRKRVVPETPLLDKLADIDKRVEENAVKEPSKILMSIGVDSSAKSDYDKIQGKFKFRYRVSEHRAVTVWNQDA